MADGAYSGMDNVEQAKKQNIELVTTALTGTLPSKIHSKFFIDETTKDVIQCPAGYKLIYCNHNEKRDDYRLTFERNHCENCPNKEACKAKIQQKNAIIKISNNMIKRARYLQKLSDKEYKKIGNFRNGVEEIPSILRRRYQVDNIPAKGYLRSKIWYSFKIGAINITRILSSIQCNILAVILSLIIRVQKIKFDKTGYQNILNCSF